MATFSFLHTDGKTICLRIVYVLCLLPTNRSEQHTENLSVTLLVLQILSEGGNAGFGLVIPRPFSVLDSHPGKMKKKKNGPTQNNSTGGLQKQ